MSRSGVPYLVRLFVTLAVVVLGAIVYLSLVWLLAVIHLLPASLGWLVPVLGPVVIGGIYIAALFTTIGKYLLDLPPGSLG